MCVFVSYLQALVLGENEGREGYVPDVRLCVFVCICVYLCGICLYLRRGHTNSKYTSNTEVARETSFSGKTGTIWSCVYLRVFACICARNKYNVYLNVFDCISNFQIQPYLPR